MDTGVTNNLLEAGCTNKLCPFQYKTITITLPVDLAEQVVGCALLLSCIADAPRTEHYQLVPALSAGAVVTVL